MKQLLDHLRSKNNPHKVEANQTGAYRLDGDLPLTEPLNLEGLATLLQNATPQSSAPDTPSSTVDDIYLDDGTNTASGNPGWRRYTGSAWEDISPGGAGSDPTAIHDNVAGEILAIASKGFPVGTDKFIIEDSADSNNKKHVQMGYINHDMLSNFTPAEHFTEASIDHGAIAGLADDDHESYPPVYVSGSLRSNPLIMAGAQAIDGSSVSVTLPTAYTATTSYLPFAIKRGTPSTPYVTGTVASSASLFTIYLSGSMTGTIYWFTIGY